MEIRMEKIAIGMVLFCPDERERLKLAIKKAISQADGIYIFDNSPEKNSDLSDIKEENVIYMTENKNKGIAYALNKIMARAKEDGYKWVVTMDQDSILPDGLIEDYKRHLYDNDNIAIICPQIIDKRRAYMKVSESETQEYIEECITSASCTNIEIWEKVGRFDEWLFIDLVDNEFCKRLQINGYSILRLNKWVLDQEFGKIKPKSKQQQQFWLKLSKILNSPNIAKFSYYKYVSPARVYYTSRNIIYVNKKLKKYGPVAYQNYNCKGYAGFIISFIIPSFLRAQQKGKVLRAIIKGTADGIKKKVTPMQ